ncbi:MAG: hypothetical protein AB7H66_16000 [Hyphomonadaceae bacterium]
MKRILVAALFLAFGVNPVAAQTTLRQYRCSNSTVLRVLFDEDAGTATVVPFARPSIRLVRMQGDGPRFRYVRRDTHELSGTRDEVVWRVGRAQWTCRRGT